MNIKSQNPPGFFMQKTSRRSLSQASHEVLIVIQCMHACIHAYMNVVLKMDE